MTTAMQLARIRVEQLNQMGLFYCNELAWRCSNPRCRDCSTAVSDICNHSGADISPCGTSFSLADWCFDTPRPDWFSKMYGYQLPGTFISYEAAHQTPCMGLRGSNYGRNADRFGDGHVEWVLGEGKKTWGAHSHASGVGYDDDGIDQHQLSFFAVPPHFLPWMVPAPPIDWGALHILMEWKERVSKSRVVKNGKRVTGALAYGDNDGDVLILNKLLHNAGYLIASPGTGYGLRTWHAVNEYKTRNGWPKGMRSGKTAGRAVANSILK